MNYIALNAEDDYQPNASERRKDAESLVKALNGAMSKFKDRSANDPTDDLSFNYSSQFDSFSKAQKDCIRKMHDKCRYIHPLRIDMSSVSKCMCCEIRLRYKEIFAYGEGVKFWDVHEVTLVVGKPCKKMRRLSHISPRIPTGGYWTATWNLLY